MQMKRYIEVSALLVIVVFGAGLAMGTARWRHPPLPTAVSADALALRARPGDVAEGSFTVRNLSDRPIELLKPVTSCGCTVAQAPATL